ALLGGWPLDVEGRETYAGSLPEALTCLCDEPRRHVGEDILGRRGRQALEYSLRRGPGARPDLEQPDAPLGWGVGEQARHDVGHEAVQHAPARRLRVGRAAPPR